MPHCYEGHITQPYTIDGRMVRLTRNFVIGGTTDPTEVLELVIAAASIVFAGLIREGGEADPKGGGNWGFAVRYATIGLQQAWNPLGEGGEAGLGGAQPPATAPGSTEALSSSYSGDTTGGRKRITQSLETTFAASGISGTNLVVDGSNNLKVTPDGYTPVAGDVGLDLYIDDNPTLGWTGGAYAITAVGGGQWTLDVSPAETGKTGGVWSVGAENFHRAIGVSGDRVEGCEIPIPNGMWSRKVTIPSMTMTKYRLWKSLIGKTNDAPWYGFARGEVMYLGMQWTPGQGGRTDVVHHFHDEQNETNHVVAPGLVIPLKRGHHYVWVRYRPGVAVAGTLLQRPIAVYCERVVREVDFAQLEIGV